MVTQLKNHRKRFTKPCYYYQTDNCPFSQDQCGFLHVKVADGEKSVPCPKDLLRTKPCKYFKGEGDGKGNTCINGEWCRFRHIVEPKTASDGVGSSLEDIGSDVMTDVREGRRADPKKHPQYRTRPCRKYLQPGGCPFGPNCSFLHPKPLSPQVSIDTSPNGFPTSMLTSTRRPTTLELPKQSDSSTKYTPPPMRRKISRRVSLASITTHSSDNTASTSGSPITPSKDDVIDDKSIKIWNQTSPTTPHDPFGGFASMVASNLALFTRDVPFPLPLLSSVSLYTVAPDQVYNTPVEAGIQRTEKPKSKAEADGNWRKRDTPHQSKTPMYSSVFRQQQCKFFAERGSCNKGDNCNFMHICMSPVQLSVSQVESKKSQTRKRRSKVPVKNSDIGDLAPKSPDFHPMNFRIVSGNVMMSNQFNNAPIIVDKAVPAQDRSRSSGVPNQPTELEGSDITQYTSLGHPELGRLVEQREIVIKKVSDISPERERARAPLSELRKNRSPPTLVLQPDPHYDGAYTRIFVDEGGDREFSSTERDKVFDANLLTCPRRLSPKAKSSPSSPVCPQIELPNNLQFSAELP